MSKAKAARTMTCGGCGETGHNTRTCKGAAPVPAPEAAPAATVVEAVAPAPEPAKVPTPPVPIKTKIDMRERPRREAPTADRGTAASAAPYRCPKCNSVAILAIVRVKDYASSQRLGKEVFRGDQRCEQCLNKPDPTSLILKWGVKPGESVSDAEANATV